MHCSELRLASHFHPSVRVPLTRAESCRHDEAPSLQPACSAAALRSSTFMPCAGAADISTPTGFAGP